MSRWTSQQHVTSGALANGFGSGLRVGCVFKKFLLVLDDRAPDSPKRVKKIGVRPYRFSTPFSGKGAEREDCSLSASNGRKGGLKAQVAGM